MPGAQSRRLPTEEQAKLAGKRLREILSDWDGLPVLAAIEVGPVRFEFAADPGKAKPVDAVEEWFAKHGEGSGARR